MHSIRQRAKGAVLVTSLLILLVLMMLTLAAVQVANVQERLAGNTRDLDLAFQAAEAALRAGEAELERATLPAANGQNGWYHYLNAPAPDWSSPTAWASSSSRMTYALSADDNWHVASAPQYAIEELPSLPESGNSLEAGGAIPEAAVYRISALGIGGTTQSLVILQSTYRR